MEQQKGLPLHPDYDYAYDAELKARFCARTPAKVFDAHFHLAAGEVPNVPTEESFAFCRDLTEEYVGKGKLQGGLIMGNPGNFPTEERFDEERRFGCELTAANEGFVSGLLVKAVGTPENTVQWLEKYPKIVALKPYKTYARAENNYEADLLDFAPEWMWELANERNLAVIIHLSHYGDMLRDPRNGEQIRYVCQKYPNAKMVLAHCAMGHHPDKLKSGLKYLEGLDNVWMDCSGVSEALSIIYSLQTVGPKKILYGSDGYSFGFGNSGKCMAAGGNFLGIYDSESLVLPPDYQYHPIRVVSEGLLALFAAGDICGLTDSQWEDIFWNNAAELYYPLIRK